MKICNEDSLGDWAVCTAAQAGAVRRAILGGEVSDGYGGRLEWGRCCDADGVVSVGQVAFLEIKEIMAEVECDEG